MRRFNNDDRFFSPVTGSDFRDWLDRLEDVERSLDDPEMRAEAARIRDRMRGVRIDLKRHSKEPNWDLVKTKIYEPMVELKRRISEELLRRASKEALAPTDRDAVPRRFEDDVRDYYRRIGIGQ